MRKHVGMIVMAGIVVLLLLTASVAFTSGSEENVLVRTFGRTTRICLGHEDAGLKFKWPWPIERTVRYDARTFIFDDTHIQVSTKDAQSVLVTLYCAWKIEDPLKFQSSIETVKAGEERVRELLLKAGQDVIAEHRMEQLINTDPTRMRLESVESEIGNRVGKAMLDGYGVEVVMVGIKSLALPQSITQKVIEVMKEERQREIKKLRSIGDAEAMAIRERARSASEKILSFARRKAALIRSEGDLFRARFFKDFKDNPELAVFIRRLETLKAGLKNNTVMVLDGSELPQIKWFRESPGKALESRPKTEDKSSSGR